MCYEECRMAWWGEDGFVGVSKHTLLPFLSYNNLRMRQ
jgi:hypothetical protein